MDWQANAIDWQEEVYQKIQSIKEACLPDIKEMLSIVCVSIQQNEAVLRIPKENFEKLKLLKRLFECVIGFLHTPKHRVPPSFRDKIEYYENKILFIASQNKRRRPTSSLQQGQQQFQQSGISVSSLLADFSEMKI